MRILLTVLVFFICMMPLRASAQTAADTSGIVIAALNYIEGWYEGDAVRMEAALHPELAKRIVRENDGQAVLDNMSARQLIEAAERGFGKETPPELQRKVIYIHEIYRDVASVKVEAADWVDLIHLAKWDGTWKIVNVLWELTPEAENQSN